MTSSTKRRLLSASSGDSAPSAPFSRSDRILALFASTRRAVRSNRSRCSSVSGTSGFTGAPLLVTESLATNVKSAVRLGPGSYSFFFPPRSVAVGL